MIGSDDLHQALQAVCPIKQGRFELRYAVLNEEPATQVNDQGDVMAVLQLFVFDEAAEGQQPLLNSIKEQQVVFVRQPHRGRDALLEPYIKAWAQVVRQAFADEVPHTSHPHRPYPALETLMPHDLVKPKVLDLVRPRTTDDFVRALSRRSRLGHLLLIHPPSP